MKSPKWLKEWNKSVGGSRAAAIAGCSPYQTQLDVYRQMRGESPMPDLSQNPDIKRGTTFEAIFLRLLQEELGEKVKRHPQSMFEHNPDFPWAHALPDAWLPGRSMMPVELKLPRPQKFQRILFEGLPPEWICQDQHNMKVLRKRRMLHVIGCSVTVRLICVEVERDDAFCDELMRAESEFYSRVVRGEPPAVGDVSILPAPPMPPPVDGVIVKLDSVDAIKAARAYVEAQQLEGEVEELKSAAKDRLLAVANGAEVFQISDGNGLACRFYARTQDGRRTFDAKAACAFDPTLERFYRQGEAYKTFRCYELKGGTGNE